MPHSFFLEKVRLEPRHSDPGVKAPNYWIVLLFQGLCFHFSYYSFQDSLRSLSFKGISSDPGPSPLT